MRLLPQSLAGQIALVMTAAVLAATLVSFALLMAERSRAGLIEASGPAMSRLVDIAAELQENPAPQRGAVFGRGAGRISLAERSPVDNRTLPRNERLERRLLAALNDANVEVGGVRAAIIASERPDRFAPEFRRMDAPDRPTLERPGPVRIERPALDRADRSGPERTIRGREILLSAQLRDGRWLNAVFFSPAPPRGDLIRLAAFTLIAFVCVLGAALWVASRLARPLRDLGASAAQVGAAGEPQEVVVRGPGDVRQTLEAFNAMSRRVTQLLNEKDLMLGALGHDLRTPLASLRIRIDSMEPEAERLKAIQTIEEAAQLLEDILVLARQGHSGERVVVADVASVVQDLVEDYAETGAQVTLGEARRTVASCRPVLFRRLLRNLIDNALAYGDRAIVSVEPVGDRAVISVSDAGPGMSDDMMEQALRPFVRGDASRNRSSGGAGLGLAIADAIARAHGGELRLANRPESGLTASVLLPMAAGR